MIWLVWRRLRVPLGVAMGLAALLAVVAVAGQQATLAAARAVGAEHCASDRTFEGVCGEAAWYRIAGIYSDFAGPLQLAAVALPGVVGAVAGAALFGGELSRGTHVFALTQSWSRLRWWATGLLVAGVPPALAAAAAVNVVGLTLVPVGPLLGEQPLRAMTFVSSGVVPAAYAVLAFTAAAAAGLLLRSTVGALGIALAVVVLVMAGLTSGPRVHYLPPVHVNVQWNSVHETGRYWNTPPDSLVLVQGYLDDQGREIRPFSFGDLPDCPSGTQAYAACLEQAGFGGFYSYTQPASRFWPFQLIESAILLALSALALGAGAWGLRKRVA